MKLSTISFLLFALVLSIPACASDVMRSKGPGDKVDEFTLKGIDGNTYDLGEALKNSDYVVVTFWSTECPWVQPYTERVNSISSEYSSKGVSFWGVNSNSTESLEDVKSHAGGKGYVFPMLKDDNNSVADMLGATRTPEVYVIDKNGIILYHGSIDDNRDAAKVSTNHLRNALDEIIAGKEVSVKNTKFFGCTIKRAEK